MSTQEAPAAKKKRSPLERIVVWGGIVLLGLVVGLEYRGMTGYSKTLEAWESKLDKARITGSQFTLTEAKEVAQMSPTYTEPKETGSRTETTAKWFTVFSFMKDRNYQIHLSVSNATEEADVVTITTAVNREAEDAAATSRPAVIPPEAGGSDDGATAPPAATGDAEAPKSTERVALRFPGGGEPKLGVVGELLKEEVQQSMKLSDDQIAAVKKLDNRVYADLKEVAGGGLRTMGEAQQVINGMQEAWVVEAQEILGDDGMASLKEMAGGN